MVNQRNKTSKPVSKPNKKINSAPLNISYTNIRGFRTNYTHIQSFLANSSPDILAISETNLGPNINTKTDFLNSGYLPLVRKDSETHMHGLMSVTAYQSFVSLSWRISIYLTCAFVSHFFTQLLTCIFSIALHPPKTAL